MRAGRPPKDQRLSSPVLAELQAWVEGALKSAGYSSANQFLSRNTSFDKNMLYAVLNGTKLPKHEDLRRLAVALGHRPEEIAPMWFAATRAMEAGKGEHVNGRRQPVWDSLPQLDPAVRDLLLAEAQVSQLLPYQLLGLDSPPLPLVYVRQHLLRKGSLAQPRGQAEAREPADEAAPQDAIPAVEALARHDHVLLTGEPGSGKTALVQEITRRLARIWVREDAAIDPPTKTPVVPLLLPARAFTDAGSFTAALAEAVRRVYGISMLTELRAPHFAQPMRGARWLLVIDGLDEVVDQALRVRMVRAIVGHARAEAPYRFIVTSRPLPDAELRPVLHGPFAVYSVEPFGRAEVQEFAGKWFAAQNPATAPKQGRAFAREINDGRLREIVRNPLLATVAAVAKSKDPGLPLPGSRIALYERLCGYLVGSEANGRTAGRQIRQRAEEPSYRAIEWVHDHREELVEWLAERYLTQNTGLLEEAEAWVARNLPQELRETPAPAVLRHLLTETGLLVVEGTGLRFTHQTLAEYLAARATARRLPADPSADPGFKALVSQGLDPAKRTFAVFTLALWARAGGNLGALLRALLEGPPRHSLLAARLLADCGDSRPPEAALVVDRLMEIELGRAAILHRGQFGDTLSRYSGRSGADPQGTAPGEAFWVLGGIYRDEQVSARLQSVIAADELAVETRIDAALALGRCTDIDAAISILRELAVSGISAEARVLITDGILALDPDAAEIAVTILSTVRTEYSDVATTARAAQLQARIGHIEDAVRLAWSIVNEDGAYPAQLLTALPIILRHQQASAVDALLGIADGLLDKARPALRWILVELVRFGAEDRVAVFCAHALADARLIRWQMPIVAGAWAMAAGPTAIPQILDSLNQRNARDSEILCEMALRLFEAGYPDEAFEISMDILQDETQHLDHSSAPWIALSTAPPDRVSDVLSLIDQIPVSTAYSSTRLLEGLVQVGQNRRATTRAILLILGDLGHSWNDLSAALKVLKSAGDPASIATELAEHIQIGSYRSNDLAVTEAILELGDINRATDLAHAILEASNFPDKEVRVARILLISGGIKDADDVVGTIREKARFWRERDSLKLADCLASLGALSAATKLWTELLLDASSSIAVRFEACASLLHSAQRDLIVKEFDDKIRTQSLAVSERARIGALHAWAMLCSSPT